MSGGSLTSDALDAAIKDAVEKGFEVIQSDPTTLLLDLDSPYALEQFDRALPVVTEYFGVESVEKWESKSGNTHVKITLNEPVEITARFLLQAALASDGVREVLGLVQYLRGCVEPSVLFRPKAAS